MMLEFENLQERMKNLSDSELVKIVKVDYGDYRQEALTIAKEELNKRNIDASSYEIETDIEFEKNEYAGFWLRLLAFSIDIIVISIIGILFVLVWALFEMILSNFIVDHKIIESILAILGVPIYLSIPWLYFAILESSNLKATLGKLALGIIVVDSNNNKISFWRASARYWSKIVSCFVFYIGFLMAGFTKRKQALHDIIAGCLVVVKR